jgi:hypothetical protein
MTNNRNVKPRYNQISLKDIEKKDELFQILSPNPDDSGVWIYQNAWFHIGNLSAGWRGEYQLKGKGNGVYVFVIEGEITVEKQKLSRRDGFDIWETESLQIKTEMESKLLLMEVPMVA